MIDLQMGKVMIGKYKNKVKKLSAGVVFTMPYNPKLIVVGQRLKIFTP